MAPLCVDVFHLAANFSVLYGLQVEFRPERSISSEGRVLEARLEPRRPSRAAGGQVRP